MVKFFLDWFIKKKVRAIFLRGSVRFFWIFGDFFGFCEKMVENVNFGELFFPDQSEIFVGGRSVGAGCRGKMVWGSGFKRRS